MTKEQFRKLSLKERFAILQTIISGKNKTSDDIGLFNNLSNYAKQNSKNVDKNSL